jgi:hypothetical protein
MERVLALQALAMTDQKALDAAAASGESNGCSSETNSCSSQSIQCGGKDEGLNW